MLVTIRMGTTGEYGSKDSNQEVAVSDLIRSIDAPHHPGSQRLCVALDHFEINGPHGSHQCLVFKPLGRSLTDFRKAFGGSLEPNLLRHTLISILMGLDFLHQAGVVHTDLSPNNILVSLNSENPSDSTVFSRIEKLELEKPSPRKVLPERTIYVSYNLPTTHEAPVITDYGAARLREPGEKHSGDVMPGVYRAPEIIMGADWDSKIDIWAFGVMIWDLFGGTRLFRAVSADLLNDEVHLAEMVSLLGPPPVAFLERHENARKYWDADNNWIAATPIPDQTLESREIKLRGPEKEVFMKFIRKVLCWLPEARPAAEDLYEDEFLNGYERTAEVLAAEKAMQEQDKVS